MHNILCIYIHIYVYVRICTITNIYSLGKQGRIGRRRAHYRCIPAGRPPTAPASGGVERRLEGPTKRRAGFGRRSFRRRRGGGGLVAGGGVPLAGLLLLLGCDR